MTPTVIVLAVVFLAGGLGVAEWMRRRRKRLFFASHSIDVEQLQAILCATDGARSVQVIDVRQPLDLLAYPSIIPGARRIPPKEIEGNPDLLSRDLEAVVYCTCPSDETSIRIMQKAVSLGFEKVKFLQGGLDAWKAKGYPVEPYESVFHLDTVA
jgi:rhodanese-related sulfurtransferase